LMQSSASAAERLDLLQQKDMAEHREQFMQSANAMVDELNRIALDIHGLFESDVPDDIWKGYNKGDRSIFARRLFRTKDAYLVPAIEQRYGTDARFRDLVGRYLERFEAMLTAVQPVDPDQVLTSAFLTADVGKLYLVLSRSLGRETEH
jgi:DNA-binding transcriptional ArsR family regulator